MNLGSIPSPPATKQAAHRAACDWLCEDQLLSLCKTGSSDRPNECLVRSEFGDLDETVETVFLKRLEPDAVAVPVGFVDVGAAVIAPDSIWPNFAELEHRCHWSESRPAFYLDKLGFDPNRAVASGGYPLSSVDGFSSLDRLRSKANEADRYSVVHLKRCAHKMLGSQDPRRDSEPVTNDH